MKLVHLIDPRRWHPVMVFAAVLVSMFAVCSVITPLALSFHGAHELNALKKAFIPWLFAWRCGMYTLVATFWITRCRPGLIQRLNADADGGHEAGTRLRRLEYASLIVVLCVEAYNLVDFLGSGS